MKKQNLIIFVIIFLLNLNTNILFGKNSKIYQKAKIGGSNLRFKEQTDLSKLRSASKNLIECNLPGAQLIEANLYRTDLTDSNLSQANLNNACCRKIIAPGVNLSGTFLSGTDFSGANLIRANISGNPGFFKTWWQKITFRYDKNYLKFRTNINFKNAILQNALLNDCYLINIDFRKAALIGTNFKNSIIINCDFSSIKNLRNTNFSNTIIYNTNFKHTNFSGSIVNNANFYIYDKNILQEAQIEYLLKNGANIYLNNILIKATDFFDKDYLENQDDQQSDPDEDIATRLDQDYEQDPSNIGTKEELENELAELAQD
ncbi:pentapeptide repeat-containing protein [Candidatus Babeliales bacterium]|nr:pentapeptide repeat-containing protein [Candidatus Babeliales bacterium]